MKTLSRGIAAIVLASTLALGGATAAQASGSVTNQWGDPGPQPYCSASIACYGHGANGQNLYAPNTVLLTQRENRLLATCQFSLLSIGFGASAATLRTTLATVFGFMAVGVSSCTDLYNSTTRFR